MRVAGFRWYTRRVSPAVPSITLTFFIATSAAANNFTVVATRQHTFSLSTVPAAYSLSLPAGEELVAPRGSFFGWAYSHVNGPFPYTEFASSSFSPMLALVNGGTLPATGTSFIADSAYSRQYSVQAVWECFCERVPVGYAPVVRHDPTTTSSSLMAVDVSAKMPADGHIVGFEFVSRLTNSQTYQFNLLALYPGSGTNVFRVRSSVQLSVTMGTAPRRVYLGRFSIPVNKDDMLGWTWPAAPLFAADFDDAASVRFTTSVPSPLLLDTDYTLGSEMKQVFAVRAIFECSSADRADQCTVGHDVVPQVDSQDFSHLGDGNFNSPGDTIGLRMVCTDFTFSGSSEITGFHWYTGYTTTTVSALSFSFLVVSRISGTQYQVLREFPYSITLGTRPAYHTYSLQPEDYYTPPAGSFLAWTHPPPNGPFAFQGTWNVTAGANYGQIHYQDVPAGTNSPVGTTFNASAHVYRWYSVHAIVACSTTKIPVGYTPSVRRAGGDTATGICAVNTAFRFGRDGTVTDFVFMRGGNGITTDMNSYFMIVEPLSDTQYRVRSIVTYLVPGGTQNALNTISGLSLEARKGDMIGWGHAGVGGPVSLDTDSPLIKPIRWLFNAVQPTVGGTFITDQIRYRLYSIQALYTPTAVSIQSVTLSASPQSALVGSTVTLSAIVSNGVAPFHYFWRRNGVVVNGADAPTLSIANAQPSDLTSYSVHVTANDTLYLRAASQSVTRAVDITGLTISPASPVLVNTAVTFSVAGLTGDGPFSIVFSRGGTTLQTSASQTYSIASAQVADGGLYSVTVTSTLSGTQDSASANLDVMSAPVIDSVTIPSLVTVGDSVTLSASVTNPPSSGTLSFEWFRGATLIGTTNPLTFTAALASAGDYRLEAVNSIGRTVSSTTTMVVRGAPVINSVTIPASVREGDSVTLSVSFTNPPSSGDATVTWLRGGAEVGTGVTLQFVAAMSSAGDYAARVANDVGATTSAPAQTLNVVAYCANTNCGALNRQPCALGSTPAETCGPCLSEHVGSDGNAPGNGQCFACGCVNGGICFFQNGGAACQCVGLWTGPTCAVSTDASLARIVWSRGAFSTTSEAPASSVSVTVADDVESVNVAPETSNAAATAVVQGNPATLFFGSQAGPSIVVTAQDGVTTRTYTSTISRTLCSYPAASQRATDLPATLRSEQASFIANTLSVVYRESMRYAEEDLQQRDFGELAGAQCGAAWSWTLTRHIGGTECAREFRGVASWPVVVGSGATGCGVGRDDTDPEAHVFGVDFSVTNRERIGSVRGQPLTRDKTHSLPFQVRFPRNAVFTSNFSEGGNGGIIVIAEVALVTAISRQAVVALPPARPRGEVDVLASVQWPFTVSSPAWTKLAGVTAPGDAIRAVGSLVLQSGDPNTQCASTLNAVCQRVWRATLEDVGSQCSFNGAYELQFEIGCQPTYVGCPLDTPEERRALMSFTLASSSHCAEIVATVGLSAAMQSFSVADGQYTENSAFLHNQRAYFRFQVSAPQAAIRSSEIVSVVATAQGAGGPVVALISGGVPTGTMSFQRTPGGAASAGGASVSEFSFVIDQALLGVVPDSSRAVSVSAAVLVTFEFQGQTVRALLRSDDWAPLDEPAATSRRVSSRVVMNVRGDGSSAPASSASAVLGLSTPQAALAGFVLVVAALLVAIAVFALRRRAHRKRMLLESREGSGEQLARSSSAASVVELGEREEADAQTGVTVAVGGEARSLRETASLYGSLAGAGGESGETERA